LRGREHLRERVGGVFYPFGSWRGACRGRILDRVDTGLDSAVTLRWRTAADAAAIARLALSAFAEYSPTGGRDAVRMVEVLPTLVACRGAALIGFAAIEIHPGVAALQAIAVSEHERGRGAGRRLLAAAEQAARSHGARVMTLHTAEANLAAYELFVRSGYAVERRIPRYYRGVFGACAMRKALGR
jgi:ribosomal protein S18 acetylase RimI-like enzyme